MNPVFGEVILCFDITEIMVYHVFLSFAFIDMSRVYFRSFLKMIFMNSTEAHLSNFIIDGARYLSQGVFMISSWSHSVFNNFLCCVISFDIVRGVQSLKCGYESLSKACGSILVISLLFRGPGANLYLTYNLGVYYIIGSW